MSDRCYIATKSVRHVAISIGSNWRAICPRGPEWDYAGDYSSFIWDVTPDYSDPRWLLPLCKRCVAAVAELRFAVDFPDPS